MVLGPKISEIFEKKHENPQLKNTKKAHRIRKNQNLENRASSCSNQAQMTPWAKISWSYDFWSFRKTRTDKHTHRHTRFMFYKYRKHVCYSCLCPCCPQPPKTQLHGILTSGLIWTTLKLEVPMWSSVRISPLVVNTSPQKHVQNNGFIMHRGSNHRRDTPHFPHIFSSP